LEVCCIATKDNNTSKILSSMKKMILMTN